MQWQVLLRRIGFEGCSFSFVVRQRFYTAKQMPTADNTVNTHINATSMMFLSFQSLPAYTPIHPGKQVQNVAFL